MPEGQVLMRTWEPQSLPEPQTQVSPRKWASAAALQQFIMPGLPILFPVCTVLLWLNSLQYIDVRLMNNLGLVSVLPPSFFAAVLVLTAGFCIVLFQSPLRTPLLFLHVAVLIFVLYGTTALVEEIPRFAATWKHLGITDYIVQNEIVKPQINAYFNWPIFFAIAALLTEAAGLENLIGIVSWSHVFFNFLYLAPLLMIFGSFTRDKRLVWLAIWFFYMTNWVGQDYFAPQALGYFLYLVCLGIVVRWFTAGGDQPTVLSATAERIRGSAPRVSWVIGRLMSREQAAPARPWQRAGLMAVAIAAYAALVPIHQLTPFAALFAVTALVMFGRITPRSLPILMAAILITWMGFMAVPYFRGHLSDKLGAVGSVEDKVSSNVSERIGGSPQRVFVLRTRVVFTAAVLSLAIAGGIRRLWKGSWDVTPALLVVAPVFLVGVQGYGGEMFLRVYYFCLPGLAFFAAALFFPEFKAMAPWRTSLVVGLVSVALFGGFLIARHGNERIDYYTSQELAAMEYFYSVADPGARLFVGTDNLPWKSEEYVTYRYIPVGSEIHRDHDINALIEMMHAATSRDFEAYVLVTRSQETQFEANRGLNSNWREEFGQALMASGRFEIIYSNPDATIYVLSAQARSDTNLQDH